jgi:peptidoglycan/LPS O-acetylase OafA/YrhL
MINRRIEFLDFAKGFAILSIVLFHYSQPYTSGLWSKAIMIGGMGVHLFFILSGFGLGLSSTKLSFATFYKKRFTKILIPYYVTILLIAFINEVYPIYGRNSLYAIGGHLFLYKMFDEQIMGNFGYHFWFISTIVQFYIVFPLILSIRKKLSLNHFLLVSFFISFIYWVIISALELSNLRIFNSFFLQYLWEFNLGIILAASYLRDGKCFWDNSINLLAPVSIIGLSIMAIMALKGGRLGQTFNDLPASVGYTCFVASTYIVLAKLKPIRSFLAYIGQISYELYLLHMLSFLLLNKLLIKLTGLNPNIFVSILVVLPISIMISKYFTLIVNSCNNFITTRNKRNLVQQSAREGRS